MAATPDTKAQAPLGIVDLSVGQFVEGADGLPEWQLEISPETVVYLKALSDQINREIRSGFYVGPPDNARPIEDVSYAEALAELDRIFAHRTNHRLQIRTIHPELREVLEEA